MQASTTTDYKLIPHSSLLIPHSSLLIPHSSLLIPHSSLLTSSTTNYPLPTISRSYSDTPTDRHGMHRFQCPVCC